MFGQIRKCSIVHFLQLGDALLDRGGLWEYISLFRVNPQKMILN